MRFFSRRRPRPDQIQAFYEEYGPGLLLYARSLVGSKHTAEDALQHVFMKLLEQGSVPEEPKLYLYRAIHNAALNLQRGSSRAVDIGEVEPWFEAPPEDITTRVALKNALLQIPAEQRQVVVLHTWGGLHFEEIAEVLGVAANTAASRYRYGLQKLRAAMQPKDAVHE
jgi:RNA polymerase sigma-70 factor (ECF subfamily)